jgi:GcrA cell cycle regulator
MSPWTPARVDRLRHLWTVEGCTSTQIAVDLDCGVSRAAVCGMLSRFGLKRGDTSRPVKPKPPPKPKAKHMPKPKINPRPASSEPVAPPPPPTVTLPYHEHNHLRHCAYVIGEPRDLIHCGHRRRYGSSYCEHHHVLCHAGLVYTAPRWATKPTRRERAA